MKMKNGAVVLSQNRLEIAMSLTQRVGLIVHIVEPTKNKWRHKYE